MNTSTMPNDAPVAAAATSDNAVASLDSIASKMAAMREGTQRNQMLQTKPTETGAPGTANTAGTPVAPTAETDSVEPEIDSAYDNDNASTEDQQAQDTVSDTDDTGASTSAQGELIDFVDFAETNPNAKFKFMKNGREVVIDAKKAAAILGQGGAIHEEARQLKIERSAFDEYTKETKAKQDGLLLAMEFTIQPRLQGAYDEIIKTQGYQNTFQQQLAQTNDPGHQARIRANMQQNERYIQQHGQLIGQIKPQVDQFYENRREQVKGILDSNRRAFTDKELKNDYVYNEVRDKVSKNWAGAKTQLVPGVDNIDLIASDEHILSLLRDGLKFRDRPKAASAGSSIAALQGRKGSSTAVRSQDQAISQLRDQAKGGDKKAADNLLTARLQSIRAARK